MKRVAFARVRAMLLSALFCMLPAMLHAQKPTAARPTNIKLLDEYKDGKGNIVRVIQFSEGLMRVTQTIVEPIRPTVGINIPIRMDTVRKDSLSIHISKTSYMLTVRYRGRTIRTYKAVFGPNPKMNKLVEGDRNTPEGEFKIVSKNAGSKYDRFMGINYPNDSAFARFNRMKAAGQIPASARIGGDVGIHGIWPGGDDLIKLGVGWTDGCIALTNKDIEDLFNIVQVGTKVVIRK